MAIKQILDHQFRTNPAYKLIAYDRLSPSEQTRLGELTEDENFYGVMVNGAVSKAVDPETALLALTLSKPGNIPTYVRRRFGQATNQAVAELVLDGVLQIKDGNEFLSGPAAHSVIYDAATNRATSSHPLAKLSYNALRYGQELPVMSPDLLAQRLYRYNTIPLSAQWQQALPSATAVAKWLGLNGWMAGTWQRIDKSEFDGWISWRHRQSKQQTLPYKLYISPHPDILAEVFHPIVETLGKYYVPSFKIGKDVNGVLRPDKMVAYLPSFDDLAAIAQALQVELANCPPQGVPFTAPIDAAGLLSWGMDPPDAAQIFAGDTRESWRYWIAQQLAAALNAAKMEDTAVAPWQFALDRLQLDGIDTERWIPQQTIWKRIVDGR